MPTRLTPATIFECTIGCTGAGELVTIAVDGMWVEIALKWTLHSTNTECTVHCTSLYILFCNVILLHIYS